MTLERMSCADLSSVYDVCIQFQFPLFHQDNLFSMKAAFHGAATEPWVHLLKTDRTVQSVLNSSEEGEDKSAARTKVSVNHEK